MKRFLVVVLTFILLFGTFTGCASKKSRYESATKLMDEGKFEQANEILEKLEGFEDSQKLLEQCKNEIDYAAATALKDDKNYLLAVEAFSVLGSFKDAQEQAAECQQEYDYAAAKEAVNNENFSAAIDLLQGMGDYKDTQKLLADCENGMAYTEAVALFNSGDYSKAQECFFGLKDYKDSADYYDKCLNNLAYAEALDLISNESWQSAVTVLEKLGDFKDSKEQLIFAQQRLAQAEELAKQQAAQANQAAYDKAMTDYNAGKYYRAYSGFSALGNYADAATMANVCKQDLPSTGSLSTNEGSSVNLTIVAPSGSNSVYIKIYSGSSIAATVFLRPGGSATVGLSGGTYTVKAAYGTQWWGTTELFGDSGSYTKLMNGGSSSFSLVSGNDYKLTLLASVNGNVGSQSVGRGSF